MLYPTPRFKIVALLLACGLALPSQAGLFDDDEARRQIADIRAQHEARIAELSSKLEQAEARGNQKTLDLMGQIDQLTQQISGLRGQLEVVTFNLQNLQKRQQDLYTDLDSRLRPLEAAKTAQLSAEAAASTAAAQAEAEANTAYDAAYSLYLEKKYKLAGDALSSFAGKFASSKSVPKALYWGGMAHAQSGNTTSAQLLLRKLVDSYPDNDKSPDALLAIASLQKEKGDKKGSAKTVKELLAAYPDTPAAQDAAKLQGKP